jgi:hypothetical protein
MASRSGPSGEGRAAHAGAVVGAALYTAGSVAGASALAVAVSTLGSLVGAPAVRLLVAGVLAIVVLVAVATGKWPWLPQRRWQVPQWWFRRWGKLAMLPAGFTLSVGFITPVWLPTYYVLVLSYFAVPPRVALLVGMLYGLARSSPNWKRAFEARRVGIDPLQLRLIGAVYARTRPVVMVGLIGIAGIALFQVATS